MDMESRMFLQELCDTCCSVWETAVPQKDHIPSEVAEKVRKKLDDLQRTNVLVLMKSTVQPQSMSAG